MNEKNIKIPEKLQGALAEYQNLVRDTLFINTEKMQENIDVGIKDYVKYILREGTNKAKRELVQQLPIPRLLHNKKLIV